MLLLKSFPCREILSLSMARSVKKRRFVSKTKKWLMPSELIFMVRKILKDHYYIVCKKWIKFVKNREKEEPGLGSINK